MRAQLLIADEARGALVRAEAAYTEASQRLVQVRREATDTQSRAHQCSSQTRTQPRQNGGDREIVGNKSEFRHRTRPKRKQKVVPFAADLRHLHIFRSG